MSETIEELARHSIDTLEVGSVGGEEMKKLEETTLRFVHLRGDDLYIFYDIILNLDEVDRIIFGSEDKNFIREGIKGKKLLVENLEYDADTLFFKHLDTIVSAIESGNPTDLFGEIAA